MLRDEEDPWRPICYGAPEPERRPAARLPAAVVSRTYRALASLLMIAVAVGFSFAWLHAPEDGELTIKTIPSGATIFVDGFHRGSSPVRLSGLRPGTHQLRALKPGYKGVVLLVEVFPSKNENLNWMLEPENQAELYRQLAALQPSAGNIPTRSRKS